jgi:DNA-binding response OmpR family regulator
MSDKIRILIVEDEISVAMLMTCLLTRAGFDIKVATNARLGLQLAVAERFDLITLDVDMPGMDGFSTCRHLKEIRRFEDTPIIFVSADTDISRGNKLGAADYIVKPFDGNDFVLRVLSQITVRNHATAISKGKNNACAEAGNN